jgi:hypothetical protein
MLSHTACGDSRAEGGRRRDTSNRCRCCCIRPAGTRLVTMNSAPVPLPSPAGRTAAALREKVPVMAAVACFCGFSFSFDGDAGACPECGKVASVTGLAVPGSSGCGRPGTPDAEIGRLSGVPGARQRPVSA